MDSSSFIRDLETSTRATLDRLDTLRGGDQDPATRPEVVRRLKLALRQELEAAEIAALWMPTTDIIEVKLALARLCGDEARHYRLIVGRLAELGEDVAGHDPFAQGRTGLYKYFADLHHPVERIAAAQFTREAIGCLRNDQFIEFCLRAGDTETARMYREDIQPDERFHVQDGRALLEKHAVDEDSQTRARAAAEHTLELAEGVLKAMVQQHMSCAPGC